MGSDGIKRSIKRKRKEILSGACGLQRRVYRCWKPDVRSWEKVVSVDAESRLEARNEVRWNERDRQTGQGEDG